MWTWSTINSNFLLDRLNLIYLWTFNFSLTNLKIHTIINMATSTQAIEMVGADSSMDGLEFDELTMTPFVGGRRRGRRRGNI